MLAIEAWKPKECLAEPLTEDETIIATSELSKKAFPQINRKYIDPVIPGQKFSLISFIPAKGTKPNEKGFYGYIKTRGTYNTIEEADSRSEFLIKNVDSTNSIYTCHTGHPVPLVVKGCAESLNEVDIQKEVEQDVSNNVRSRATEERKKMEEIKERERELKEDVSEPHPEDDYIAKRVKLATLRFTISEHARLKKECEELRDKCILELLEAQKTNPEYEERHLAKYLEARKKANIPDDQELTGFMKFIRYPILEDGEEPPVPVVPKPKMTSSVTQSIQTETNSPPKKVTFQQQQSSKRKRRSFNFLPGKG
jgi:hypothetical protein